ncbi:MAG: uracil phosphoribosyltransferase [Bacteroidota bacterium]|nr:uracil phosphoribosyltransferase [Bacteroidota bacterium]
MAHVSNHPLVRREITILRSSETSSVAFRGALRRVSQLLVYEASTDLQTEERPVKTPLESTTGSVLARPVILVPVLRAGLGMVEAFLDMFPEARVGHVGLYRDEETLEAVEYYGKYPASLEAAVVFLLDPMLATGGSAVTALRMLRARGAKDIRLISLVSAPEGVRMLENSYPDVPVYTAAMDRGLNEKGYIVPGLGDAGDRIFGTGMEAR